MIPNVEKITPKLNWSAKIGNTSPTASDPVQLKADEIPAPIPRTESGKISPTMIHVSGAQENA